MSTPLLKRLKKATRPLRHWLLESSIRLLLAVFGRLPVAFNANLFESIAGLAAYLLPAYTAIARRNLDIAFGTTMSTAEKHRIAHDVIRRMGRNAGELLSYRDYTPTTFPHHIEVQGLEDYLAHFETGQGAIVIGPHLGNWELQGGYFASLGPPLHVIVRKQDQPGIEDIILRIRQHWGMNIHWRSPMQSAKQALRVLRSGEALGLLIDQDVDVNSVFVPFFGELAKTPSGPAHLSLKTGAPVFLTFIERIGPLRHRITIDGPLCPPNLDDREEAVRAFTTELNERLEEEIRRRPADWVWFHERWKSRPPQAPLSPQQRDEEPRP